MGTIFVAYGEPERRTAVLEFAARQASASGHDLYVYHVQEGEEEDAAALRTEAEEVLARVAPGVTADVAVEERESFSDDTNVSPQKRLTDAVLESGREYEYVVMGAVERTAVEGVTHASMTKAVLETRAVPVLLVPV
ncbi:universal stress protein (plasmid) [Halarchaeum sp. CBA1220]|uniref:universal stress protein n=1 Tax=Halarchaeum sp. CBA1220 TaxID=1853682 RepID=UPI000F3AA668|nr:universal stress protein [Halarchaeum sp. CBA1220]QLC35013.1 universal stress protein [Halarchaeum sp. CBA1220]